VPFAARSLVHSVAFSPDGACLASGASDGAARLLDTRSGALLQAHAAHAAPGAPSPHAAVHALSWHPSGAFLLGACADAALRLWDVRAGALAFTCHGHGQRAGAGGASAGALAAAFSPAGDFFASGGADAQLLVWRTRIDRDLGAHRLCVRACAGRAGMKHLF
jgi:centriolar protein POC1